MTKRGIKPKTKTGEEFAQHPARTADEQALVDAVLNRPHLMTPPEFSTSKSKGTNLLDTDGSDPELWNARLLKTSALPDLRLVDKLLGELLGLNKEAAKSDIGAAANLALAGIAAIGPKDAIESYLAAQMLACHQAAMACYIRALHPDQTFAGRDMNLRHAVKLSRLYADQAQVLAKYRNRGQQTVRVEHVTVNGNAIVGNVAPPGGGATIGIEGQPHAQQLTHASIAAMRSPDPVQGSLPIPGDGQRSLPDARRQESRGTEE